LYEDRFNVANTGDIMIRIVLNRKNVSALDHRIHAMFETIKSLKLYTLKRIANRLIRGKVAKWGQRSKKLNFKMADENLMLPFWHL
jgi:hypothetical protein